MMNNRKLYAIWHVRNKKKHKDLFKGKRLFKKKIIIDGV